MGSTLDPVAVRVQDHEFDLVREARAGSRIAFDQLFEQHKKFIYNVCYRMLGSSDDALDAMQNVFIRAYRGVTGFRERSCFRSWLCRIAINESNSLLRRELRGRAISVEMIPSEDNDSAKDLVWEVVLKMRPDLRAVLVLFYFQGLSCDEIAESIGCSSGATRTRLHRARAAFKAEYEELVK
jgi:RNA polymerase sigma-70 factor (ECF subfamily)